MQFAMKNIIVKKIKLRKEAKDLLISRRQVVRCNPEKNTAEKRILGD